MDPVLQLSHYYWWKHCTVTLCVLQNTLLFTHLYMILVFFWKKKKINHTIHWIWACNTLSPPHLQKYWLACWPKWIYPCWVKSFFWPLHILSPNYLTFFSSFHTLIRVIMKIFTSMEKQINSNDILLDTPFCFDRELLMIIL